MNKISSSFAHPKYSNYEHPRIVDCVDSKRTKGKSRIEEIKEELRQLNEEYERLDAEIYGSKLIIRNNPKLRQLESRIRELENELRELEGDKKTESWQEPWGKPEIIEDINGSTNKAEWYE